MTKNHESFPQASLNDCLTATADAWRILGQMGLVDSIFNHISTAALDTDGQLCLLMNPEGLLASEVSPEAIRVIPFSAISAATPEHLGVNADGYRLHSVLQQARGRQGSIIHTHSLYALAVGCSESLLPLSQTALEFVDDVTMVDYSGMFRGGSITDELKELATRGGVALLRNHGLLAVADSVAEAFYLVYFMEEACRIQVTVLSQRSAIRLCPREAWAVTKAAMRTERPRVASQLFEAFRRRLGRSDYR
jgi:ribulose-5-phosphate 4-epimerase/fuculose-1-phosphate aldolase